LRCANLASAEIGLLSILEIIFGTRRLGRDRERPSQTALIGGAIVIGALAANQLAGRGRRALRPFKS